jgi:hypothetical protein
MRRILFILIVVLIAGVVKYSKSQQIKNNLRESVIPKSIDIDTTQTVIPWRSTTLQTANEQLLYFTSTSLLKDDRHLIFLSDRTGNPNIFMRDLKTGKERQLSNNKDGILKSYVYFDGIPYKGLGKASISLDPDRGLVYYLQGRSIMVVDTSGAERKLGEYPLGQMTAFTHVSADGKLICIPTTDAHALDGDKILSGKPDYDIDKRVQEENLSSYLRVYDTRSGKEVRCERVPKGWITHVQFSPVNNRLILYNYEYTADSGTRRMWLWDGKKHIQLRDEANGRSRYDWTCHEMWQRDGKAIIYHGNYDKGPAYIGKINPDGTGRVEITLPAGWKRYGHFTVGDSGILVSDGYYAQTDDNQYSPDSNWAGMWICLLKVDWEQKHIQWIPLCRSGSSWRSQDEHPHPIINHASTGVFFTSDKDGKRAIWQLATVK